MDPEDLSFAPENLAKLVDLADAGTVNSSVAKEVFEQIFKENVDPEVYIEEHGLKTVNDEGALKATIEQIVSENPQSVADYKGGKKKRDRISGGTDHESHERKSRSGEC